MINYTVHAHALARTGIAKAAVPLMRVPPAGERLGLGVASAVISGPCEIRVLPDEDIYFDVRNVAADLNPAASPMKLLAGTENWFELPQGPHYIQGSAA
ncbi:MULTISPECIES: hypothetical protein [unclassified Sphingomonas]|uniref:hypothetical protein n=1 Tax=unclassified Sphingomonas TaxID=196159 RepID=UPI0008372451|nr:MULTISPECIES: hypothetical protein [unclassified Sphingomonas]